jgi:hypothetical protein
VDASDLGGETVRVRLHERGVPVVGAYVDAGLAMAVRVTDAIGWVSWRSAPFAPPKAWVAVQVPGRRTPPLLLELPTTGGEIDLPLPTGALTVRTAAPEGRPTPDAVVTLDSLEAAVTSWRVVRSGGQARTDATGVVAWSNVPPGRYRVEARFGETRASAEVTVGGGPVEVEVRAPRTGRVRVVVHSVEGARAPDVPVGASHLPPGTEPTEAAWRGAANLTQHGWRTDAQGVRVLEGVPEGRVRVYAWVMPPGAHQVSANAQAEVVVTPGDEVEAVLRLAPLK